MSDEVINCADCRIDFSLTVSEADFFTSKGLTKPRRCKPCRQKRREAKAADSSAATAAAAPLPPQPTRGRTQWVGGGEVDAPRRDRANKRERRNRGSDDYGF